jgi:hypothetical protein
MSFAAAAVLVVAAAALAIGAAALAVTLLRGRA